MKKFLGAGAFGSCYLVDDLKVMKIFYEPMEKNFIDPNLVGIDNDTYIFYEKLIKSNKKIVAAISRYINSLDLNHKDIGIDDLISSVSNSYSDTDILSDTNIVINDIQPKNMLYDGHLRIIDTDFYYLNDNLIQDLENNNIQRLNEGYGSFFPIPEDFIKERRNLLNLYYQTFSINSDNKTIKEFLILLKQELEMYEEKNFITVSEMKKSLLRIK